MRDGQPAFPIALAKTLLALASLLPFAWILWQYHQNGLGNDPTKAAQNFTGLWTLNFLLLTLAISPLRAITQQHWLLRLRRMLGLFTFAYALAHLFAFIAYEHAFSVGAISADFLDRPFVALGLAALALMLPLAATSNAYAVRRMGGRKWQELHRNIYLIAILACLHQLWQSEANELPRALSYCVLLGLLLWWRIQDRRRKAMPASSKDVQAVKFYPKRPR